MNLTLFKGMGIDYFKCLLSNDLFEKLRKHPLLEFIIEVNEQTGEELPKKVAEYKGLKFIVVSSRIWLAGSLHYFYNQGLHNHNDFTYDMGCKALDEIQSLFGIDVSISRLENLEVAVNIRTGYKTKVILNNLLIHGTTRFKDIDASKGKGNYRRAYHCNFSIKAYDKALQFGLPYELFRFEIHFNRMRDLKKHGIVYLGDLRDKSKLELLKGELLNKWDELLLYDWTIDLNVPEHEKPKGFNDWRLASYWEELNKSNRNKRKVIYRKFVEANSSNVQLEIRRLIEYKMNELIYPKATFSPG